MNGDIAGTSIPLTWFLALSAVLFGIGLIGVLTRRNVLVIFMSVELMMNAVSLSLLAFARALNTMTGQIFVVFVVTIAAAEAAIGLGLIIALARNKPTVDTRDVEQLKD